MIALGARAASFTGMSITAIVENDMIKLPMHVPDGTRVEIVLPGEDQSGPEKTAGRLWSPEELGAAAAEMVEEKDPARAEMLKKRIVAGFYGDADA